MSKRTPFIVRTIRNHTPQEINYASQKTISYSQFSIYNECPHKWKLLYKDGLQEYQPTIYTVFGTAMHNSIQHYITMMYEESTASADRFDLEGLFEEEFGKTYREEYAKNKKIHFSDPVEMREFYDDGINIINYFKKNKGKYFSKRGWHLIGCELPIVLNPNPQYPSILYKGYLDLVLYNEDTDRHKIIDFKTSTRGWNADTKKDEGKQFQLLFYKEYYSKQYNIDKDNIDVEFVILKRKIWEESEFKQSRIQEFAPPDGKIKMNRAINSMTNFIDQCFNSDGTFKDTNHSIVPNKNCQWCPFNNTESCNK